ncbi:MAG: TssQ family T6SS-associated lipoprotein [Pseudomonadota bacterium]
MKTSVRRLSFLGAVFGAALLSACAVLPEQAKPAPAASGKPASGKPAASASAPAPVVAAPLPPAQAELAEGQDLYDKGDFNGAIRKLSGSTDIWTADQSLQLSAIKIMAFSYCVTSRQTLCRQQFEKALKMDPNFDLEPGEKQHPLWAPVFEQAKKRVAAAAKKAAAPIRKPASSDDAVKK